MGSQATTQGRAFPAAATEASRRRVIISMVGGLGGETAANQTPARSWGGVLQDAGGLIPRVWAPSPTETCRST